MCHLNVGGGQVGYDIGVFDGVELWATGANGTLCSRAVLSLSPQEAF